MKTTHHDSLPLAEKMIRFITTSALAAIVTTTTLRGDSIPYSHGDPTNFEQYQLELVNAARANPAAEATKLGIDLNKDLTPNRISDEAKQPLAFHPLLLQTARGHSDWMLSTNNFSHAGLNASTPTQRANTQGYSFSVAENIAYLSTSGTPDLNAYTISTHENLFKSPSHRPNLMEPSFSVVGLGLREGKFQSLNALMVTQNFSSGGNSTDSGPFLVGVVYKDLNKNGGYDFGEGLPGVRVEPNFGGYHAITSSSGGYAVPLPPLNTRSEDVSVPLAVNSTTWENVRPHDDAFRKSKIQQAPEISVQITWSGGAIGQAKQSTVTIHQPSRINYKLIGTDQYFYSRTMVSSLNVKADLKLSPPEITSQPPATQILNAGSSATLSVSASGTALTYQWYQGARGDTSNPVGENSSSFTIQSLASNTSYWVRVANPDGSVDSMGSVVVVMPQGIRVGDWFSADLSPMASGGKTLKLMGKLPSGLSLNTNTWQITGLTTGNPGNFTPNIQIVQNKLVLQTIPIAITVDSFPISLLGNYDALLKDQNGAPFGVFRLTIGKNVWAASLETLGQSTRVAKGNFVLQKDSPSTYLETKFTATQTASALSLKFTVDGDSPVFSGTHDIGTFEGFKVVNSIATATKPVLYNLIIDQGAVTALDKPAGKGWANGSFSNTGTGTFKGILGDATACNFSLRLSVTGQAILWARPYANKNSFIGGIIDLPEMVPNANLDAAIESKVSWVKVADSNTLSYSDGFTFEDVSVSGSKWITPIDYIALGASLGWLGGEKCTVKTYGAGLSSEIQQGAMKFPTEFTLDKSFKLTATVDAMTLKWSGSVVKGTGAFSGSYTLPAGLAANTIAGSGAASGLLLQDEKWGTTTGLGLIKVPISGTKGSFRTAALMLEQTE